MFTLYSVVSLRITQHVHSCQSTIPARFPQFVLVRDCEPALCWSNRVFNLAIPRAAFNHNSCCLSTQNSIEWIPHKERSTSNIASLKLLLIFAFN